MGTYLGMDCSPNFREDRGGLLLTQIKNNLCSRVFKEVINIVVGFDNKMVFFDQNMG